MFHEDIDSIKIEHRGEQKYWNITMFVIPLSGNSGHIPCYATLVDLAENVLRKAKDLDREWYASNAEVMAWSSRDDRGIFVPNKFRVSLDMMTAGMEAPSDVD